MRRLIDIIAVVGCALLAACADAGAHHEALPSKATGDAFEQHLGALRERLSSRLTVVAKRPFVLIGDGPAEDVVDVADRIVAKALALLKKDFFPLDPEITDIWILRDSKGYRAVTQRIFHESPGTPFGFYSPARRTMVMNLATGSGTLVHELVHPLVERNCPVCPSWFDEGLASLYERPSVRDEHLVGLPNWRLGGLKRAIADDRLASLRAMMTLGPVAFHRSNVAGDNYAEARYLLYYLQERGLLRRYYRLLREAGGDDPAGVTALRRVLDEPDLSAFEARWRTWVLALAYDG